MQRYFSYPGTGYGTDVTLDMIKELNLGASSSGKTKVMRAGRFGDWVLYDAAVKHAKAEYERGVNVGFDDGITQGRKEGQVKVDAINEINATERSEWYSDGYNKGCADAVGTAFSSQATQAALDKSYREGGEYCTERFEVERTRTNQLLNELYHDRARLEKVVADIAKTAASTAADIAALMEELYPDGVADMTQATVDLTIDAGMLRQFADTHGA